MAMKAEGIVEIVDSLKKEFETEKQKLLNSLEISEKRVLTLESKLKEKLLDAGTNQYIQYLEERLLETVDLSKKHF